MISHSSASLLTIALQISGNQNFMYNAQVGRPVNHSNVGTLTGLVLLWKLGVKNDHFWNGIIRS